MSKQDLSNKYVHTSGAFLDKFMATFLDNAKLPATKVKHRELERYEKDSAHKSRCPFCEEGILLIRREPITLNILTQDQCIYCGRVVIYEDIEEGNMLLTYKKEKSGDEKQS